MTCTVVVGQTTQGQSVVVVVTFLKKTGRISTRPMSGYGLFVIEEDFKEFELALLAASRRPLQQISTNVCTPSSCAPEAAVEQVCSARE